MFCEISGSLSHAAYTERSTIVDLLIKISGPFKKNRKKIQKVQNLSKKVKNLKSPLEICYKYSCIRDTHSMEICNKESAVFIIIKKNLIFA